MKRILLLVVVLTVFQSHTTTVNLEMLEAENSIEDMIEWVHSDVEEGYIPDYIGEAYVDNLNEVLETLKNNRK